MKLCLLTGCALFLFVSTTYSNPIDPQTLPLISEVYVENPTKWYIELDMKQAKFDISDTNFFLNIASQKKTYKLNTKANESGIAIVTLPVSIATSDTFTIIDSTSSRAYKWKFPIKPVPKGYSLIIKSPMYQGGACPVTEQTDKVTIGYRGNPAEDYNTPFISEVMIKSNKDWAIELDAKQSRIPMTKLRMQFSNSQTVFSINAQFDTNDIAVLKPGNIYSGSAKLESLPASSIMKILDSNWNTTTHSGLYWSFYLPASADSTHSIINNGDLTTIRTSIGTRMDYITQHRVHFFDNTMKPLPNVYVYHPINRLNYMPNGEKYTEECLELYMKIDSDSTTIGTSIGVTDHWLGFLLSPLTSTCVNRTSFTGISWTASYIDSLPVKNDTIILPLVVPVTNTITSHEKTIQSFFYVNKNHQQSLFSAVLPSNVSDAHVKIITLSGKLVTNVPFGPVQQAGTYSCIWDHGDRIHSGTYLCVLVVNKTEIQSLKVTIR